MHSMKPVFRKFIKHVGSRVTPAATETSMDKKTLGHTMKGCVLFHLSHVRQQGSLTLSKHPRASYRYHW